MDAEQYGSLTYKQAYSHHEELRANVFRMVEKDYGSLRINLSEISFKDVNEANTWKTMWSKPEKVAKWDWVRLYSEYHSRGGARRFDMAIRRGGALQGLCYGMMERNRLILRLHALERSPVNNDLAGKVLDITLYAAALYASINNTPEIWICDPVSPAHTRLYQGRGYTPKHDRLDRVTHLTLRLK
jgi:hypothetical protein